MNKFIVEQTVIVKLFTALTLTALILSALPFGIFTASAQSEEVPVEVPSEVPAEVPPLPEENTEEIPVEAPAPEPLVMSLQQSEPVSIALPSYEETSETVVITKSTVNLLTNPTGTGWYFESAAPFTAPFVFNTTAPQIGIGSLFAGPVGSTAQNKFIGAYQKITPVKTLKSIAYDFKIASNVAADENEFYLNVYANFGASAPTKFYDCRFDVVPTTGSLTNFETVVFDTNATTNIANVQQSGSSPFTCPTTLAGMETLSPGAVVRAFALNVGDTGAQDAGVSGYFDKVVVKTQDDVAFTKHTTIFDFEPAKLKVHVLKYLQNGKVTEQIPNNSTAPSFPMIATWSAGNIGAGSGNYVLGNGHGGSVFLYGADTSYMTAPADYTTSEITGGDSPVLPIGAECTEGKYRLVGYKSGNTLKEAEASEISTTAPVYTGIDSDKTVIVVNEDCDDVIVTPDPVCEIGDNLLQNGSFETDVVTNASQWQIFATISNWVTSLSDGVELWKNFNGTGAGLASDGLQNVELDGNDATKIVQKAPTIVGATYELSFDFSPRAGTAAANNKMDALVDGTPVLSLMADGSTTTTNTWRPQTYSFIAASTSTAIGFEDTGTPDVGGGYGPLLDNTALCLTKMPDPEPTCSLTIKSDGSDFVQEKNAAAQLLSTIHSAWVTAIPSSVAAWVWGDNPVVGGATAETQTFTKKFNWTGGTVTGATLKIASDNSHAVTLGAFSGGDATEFNYGSMKSYSVASGVVPGLNTLSIEVENFAQTNGNPASNPAGLIYDLTITGTGKSCGEVVPVVPATSGPVTMCKVDGDNLPLPGWSMTLLGAKVEDVVVPVDTAAGVNTTALLDANKSYVALASGTWNNNRTPLNTVDAEYSTEDGWTTQMDGFTGYGVDILELAINDTLTATQDWGPYNSLHTYAKMFTQASTGTAKFAIADSYHGDNTGSLNVALYKGYTGVTGKNGCVTFTDVPFGTYTAGEVMQEGWEVVSGTGVVEVGFEEPTITIKNKIIVNEEEVPDPVHTISGVKWNDLDGDGIKEDGEPNLSGWGIKAVSEGATLYATTSVSGDYSFVVGEGTWIVSEINKNGWTQTGLYKNGVQVVLGLETPRSCSITAATPVIAEAVGAAPTPIQYLYTCDFGNKEQEEEVIVPPAEETGGGGSSGSRARSTRPQGQVLGASTQACEIYLTEYMKQGAVASSTQVTKLQIFLNAVGYTFPVSGVFDDATDEAVRAFQLKYQDEVLTPWFKAGIVPHNNPTGWVYQLTRWKINNIVCPGSEAYPVLN